LQDIYGWRYLVRPSDDQKWYVLRIKRGRLYGSECYPELASGQWVSPGRISPSQCRDQSFRTSCEIKCQISRRIKTSFSHEYKSKHEIMLYDPR
jgi:hypothetical protein